MNSYCTYALHQIEVAVISVVAIIDRLDESDLLVQPTEDKHSVGESLKHIAVICRADFYISGGATQEEMDAYYEAVSLNNLKDIQAELLSDYSHLEQAFRDMTEEELHQETTSYWGSPIQGMNGRLKSSPICITIEDNCMRCWFTVTGRIRRFRYSNSHKRSIFPDPNSVFRNSGFVCL